MASNADHNKASVNPQEAAHNGSQMSGPPIGGYIPTQVGFPQPQGGNASPPGSFPPHTESSPPPAGFPPVHGSSMPPQAGYPPPQGIYPPPQAGFPPTQGAQYPPGPPITNQPVGHGGVPPSNWMSIPQNVPNCPPGLEYLTMIDNLMVHQEVEFLEVISGFETENRYTIMNSLGQKVYYAREQSDSFTRTWCGSLRGFDIKILDNLGQNVINLRRPFACQSCCCPCWLQTLEVSSPPGVVVGMVEQEWSILYPTFVIKDARGDVVLRVQGPLCTFDCCSDVDFKVLSADGTNQVGKISKKWSGYVREAYSVADNFGISFPMDLDVRMKAVMLGVCFLVDMMYFEKKLTSKSHERRQQQQQQQLPQHQQQQQQQQH